MKLFSPLVAPILQEATNEKIEDTLRVKERERPYQKLSRTVTTMIRFVAFRKKDLRKPHEDI